ncbi:MAG TPA: preprotein translocase subunit YajC [Roseomonas sp.]|nr:preprotein translocase subunit YajC [Roseomonas sp.]
MFISTAYAQDAAAAAGGAGAIVMQLAPLALIFVVFYFLLIRPQQKRAKEHREMLGALKRNDRIITAGGILGTVTKVKEGSEEVEVEIAPNVRVMVARSTISTLVRPVAANDSKPG